MADPNDFKHGDLEYDLLRKILARLTTISGGGGGGVATDVNATLTVSDIEIGAVELKNASTDDRVNVINSTPAGTEFGVVTRNIPSGTQPVSAASLPLPTGAATEATLATRAPDRTTAAAPFSVELSDGSAFYTGAKTGQFPTALVGGRLDINNGAWLGSTAPTVGQKAMASSIPVVVSSDQSAIPVSAASLPLPTGAATEATLVLVKAKTDNLDVALSTRNLEATQLLVKAKTDNLDVALSTRAGDRTTAAAPFSVELSDGSAFYTGAKTGQFPTALVGGRFDINLGSWMGATTPTVGQKTMSASIPVTFASDQPALSITPSYPALTSASPTAATVGVASAQAVAANAGRKGLVLVNTSSARVSLGFGSPAVLDSGQTLYPGDSFTMDPMTFSTAAVTAIASSSSSNLSIQEYS